MALNVLLTKSNQPQRTRRAQSNIHKNKVTTQPCETKLGKNGFPRIAKRKASKTCTPFFLAVDI